MNIKSTWLMNKNVKFVIAKNAVAKGERYSKI